MAIPGKIPLNLAHADSIDELNKGMPKDEAYDVGLANSVQDIEALQRLRYQVFNLELNEGLAASHEMEMDSDVFDAQCHHLYVRHIESNRFVGTYRMQTAEMALAGHGFYSNTLFNFAKAPSQLTQDGMEIGRACIAEDHRSLRVLYLLWKGLGRYSAHVNKKYLFGCCSLTSQDPDEGLSVYRHLKQNGFISDDIFVPALKSHTCVGSSKADASIQPPPRLMKAYLSLGASICSSPALDRAFKTIDFLAVFDTDLLLKKDKAFFRVSS